MYIGEQMFAQMYTIFVYIPAAYAVGARITRARHAADPRLIKEDSAASGHLHQ